MKARSAVVVLLVSAAMAAGAVEVKSETSLTASRADVDVAREEVNLQGVELKIGSLGVLRARAGSFRVDASEVPRVVDVNDASLSFSERSFLIAGEATYYSDLRVLVADEVSLVGSPILTSKDPKFDRLRQSVTASDLMVAMSDDPVGYTCSGGTLYADGQAVPGNSTCINTGNGGIVISCTESGDRVKMQLLDQGCPLTE